MTTLKTIEIKTNGQYKNINLKDLGVDEYIILEKEEYNEGLEKEGRYGAYFIVTANYLGEKVSFFMNPNVHTEWVKTGGIGDSIRLTKYEAKVTIKSGTLLTPRIKVALETGEATAEATPEASPDLSDEDLLS